MQTGLLTTYHKPLKTRHVGAWTLAGLLIGFFLIFYFTGWLDARLLDLGVSGKPLASLLNSATSALGLSHKWWLYSWLYTLAMVIGGVFFFEQARENTVPALANDYCCHGTDRVCHGLALLDGLFREAGV